METKSEMTSRERSALIPMVLLPVALVFRILNEEKVLKENLDDYNEYCKNTKYRLIPYIW